MSKIPLKAFASIGGMVVGLAATISSFRIFSIWPGTTIGFESYGGDAYTGIQNAAASTGNNVIYLAQVCEQGLGMLLLMLGLAMFFFFLHEFLADIERKTPYEKTPPKSIQTIVAPLPAEAVTENKGEKLEENETAEVVTPVSQAS